MLKLKDIKQAHGNGGKNHSKGRNYKKEPSVNLQLKNTILKV